MKVAIIAVTNPKHGNQGIGLAFDGRFLDLGPGNYVVGNVWELAADTTAPQHQLPPLQDVAAFIQQHQPLANDRINKLPSHPTQPLFWKADQTLVQSGNGRYPHPDLPQSLEFIGSQTALAKIPAGTMLALRQHPNRPPQLLAWYLPATVDFWPDEMPGMADEAWLPPVDLFPEMRQPEVTRPLTLETAQELLKSVFGY